MKISQFIKELLSREEYSFSLEEAVKHSNKNPIAVKREIARLVSKNEIINLRKGFYLIITPRYSKIGTLPIQLYVNKLFKYLNRKYYISLLSAAKIHGASHQQIQQDYIIIETPKLKTIQKRTIHIEFFTTRKWPEKNIIQKKADAGYYNISTPALTFTDLVHHQTKIGTLNRLLSVLEELSEEFSESDWQSLTSWYNNKSTLQRVGFLLDEIFNSKRYADIIYTNLQQTNYYPVLLSPTANKKPGSARNRWKVDINLKLESDL